MKEYCVDLEIAKELKQNGFHQNGNHYWHVYKEKDIFSLKPFYLLDHKPIDSGLAYDYFAPITDELIKELPREIKDLNFEYYYHLKIEQSPIHDERFLVSYGITNQDRAWMQQYHTEDKKLSNALALMWTLLKKEGYIHEVQRQ